MSTPIFTSSDDLKSGARRRERRSSCILRQETSGTESPAHRRVRHPPPQRIKDPFSALGFMVQKRVGLVCVVMVWNWLGLPMFSGLPSVFKGRNAVRVPPWAHIFRQAGAPTASSPADSVNILSAVARMASSSCVIIVGRLCGRILPSWIQRGCASYSFIARSGPSDMTVLELGEWDCADLLSCGDHD